MVEPKNMILILLREMRAEIADMREEVRASNAGINKRLDAMRANGLKALKSFVGHRVMVERAMGSFDDQVRRLEASVSELKAARS